VERGSVVRTVLQTELNANNEAFPRAPYAVITGLTSPVKLFSNYERRQSKLFLQESHSVKSEDEAIMFHVKHDRRNFVGKSFSLVCATHFVRAPPIDARRESGLVS
jgi:hypothetical protein